VISTFGGDRDVVRLGQSVPRPKRDANWQMIQKNGEGRPVISTFGE
jgi:hypothetical protein